MNDNFFVSKFTNFILFDDVMFTQKFTSWTEFVQASKKLNKKSFEKKVPCENYCSTF